MGLFDSFKSGLQAVYNTSETAQNLRRLKETERLNSAHIDQGQQSLDALAQLRQFAEERNKREEALAAAALQKSQSDAEDKGYQSGLVKNAPQAVPEGSEPDGAPPSGTQLANVRDLLKMKAAGVAPQVPIQSPAPLAGIVPGAPPAPAEGPNGLTPTGIPPMLARPPEQNAQPPVPAPPQIAPGPQSGVPEGAEADGDPNGPGPAQTRHLTPTGRYELKGPQELAQNARDKAKADYEASTIEIPTPPELRKVIGSDTWRIPRDSVNSKVLEQLVKTENPKPATKLDPDEIAAHAMSEEHPEMLKGLDPSKPLFPQLSGKMQEQASARAMKFKANNSTGDEAMTRLIASVASLNAATEHSIASTHEINVRNNPENTAKEIANYNAGVGSYPANANDRARWSEYARNNPDVHINAPLSGAAQKGISSIDPVLKQSKDVLRKLEALLDSDLPFASLPAALKYKAGFADNESPLLAEGMLNNVQGAGIISKAAGSRAYQFIQDIHQHQWDPYKDSITLAKIKQREIVKNLQTSRDDIEHYGSKSGVVADGPAHTTADAVKTVTKSDVTDYATKHKLSYSAAKQHVEAKGFKVKE